MAADLLETALSVSVPIWIEDLKGKSWDHIQSRAAVCSQEVASHGDLILYKSKKQGESAAAFNRLAEGIACLAFAPGGVTAFGMHFEAKMEGV